MPYRVDIAGGDEGILDRIIDLGALDAERLHDGGVAALMPDTIRPEQITSAVQDADVTISPAVGRDDGSVWVLKPPAIHLGQWGALTLTDGPAFGTGLHPTTALCLEAIGDAIRTGQVATILDVGTGSGVLALAALRMGVRRAVGTDIDDDALREAAENARLNDLGDRLELRRGGPDAVDGLCPFVTANILAAPLIEMAPALVRRVGHQGQVVLSGIASSLMDDVDRAYRRLGMQRVGVTSRARWVAMTLRASW